MEYKSESSIEQIRLADSSLSRIIEHETDLEHEYVCARYRFLGHDLNASYLACRQSIIAKSKAICASDGQMIGVFYGEYSHGGIPTVIGELFKVKAPLVYACDAASNTTPGGYVYSGAVASIDLETLHHVLDNASISFGIAVHFMCVYTQNSINELFICNPYSTNTPIRLDASIRALLTIGSDCDSYDLLCRKQYATTVFSDWIR